jgi:hypothetical protein
MSWLTSGMYEYFLDLALLCGRVSGLAHFLPQCHHSVEHWIPAAPHTHNADQEIGDR